MANKSVDARQPSLGRSSVLLLCHEFGEYPGGGGISIYARNLVDALIKHSDHDVVVVTGRCGRHAKDDRLSVHEISYFDLAASPKLKDLIDEVRPLWIEVADYGGPASDFLVRRMLGLFSSEVPVFVNHHTGSREIWEWGAKSRFEACKNLTTLGFSNREYAQYVLADANFAVSKFLAYYVVSRTSSARRIECLYPCYPLAISQSSNEGRAAKSPGSLSILSLGRFESRKNQEALIRATLNALRSGADVTVTFIGNTIEMTGSRVDYRDYCYSLIDREYRSHFHFYDFMRPAEASEAYKKAHVFCIPSVYENFPTTALEPIERGLPVMAGHKTGVAEIIQSQKFLFQSASVSSLTSKILELASMSSEELKAEASAQAANLKKMVSPEVALKARLQAYAAADQKPPCDEFVGDVLVILPNGSIIPDYMVGGRIRIFGQGFPVTPSSAERKFIYFPFVPEEKLFKRVLEVAQNSKTIPPRSVIAFSSSTEYCLDLLQMEAFNLIPVLIGSLGVSAGQGRMIGNLVIAECLSRCPTVLYLYDPDGYVGALDSDLRLNLMQKLLPFGEGSNP